MITVLPESRECVVNLGNIGQLCLLPSVAWGSWELMVFLSQEGLTFFSLLTSNIKIRPLPIEYTACY